MEVAFGCGDGLIGVWRMQGDPEEVVLHIVWKSGAITLTTQDAVIVDTVGLSVFNRRILHAVPTMGFRRRSRSHKY